MNTIFDFDFAFLLSDTLQLGVCSINNNLHMFSSCVSINKIFYKVFAKTSFLEPDVGFESTTLFLQGRRTTAVLIRQFAERLGSDPNPD